VVFGEPKEKSNQLELYPVILAYIKDSTLILWHRSVNAAAESFFHTLKTQYIHHEIFKAFKTAECGFFNI
jgi:hypothetical protein